MVQQDGRPGSGGGSGCGRALRIGCAGVAILVALGAVLVALNWTKVSEMVTGTVNIVQRLIPMQEALREQYPAAEIHVTASSETGKPGMGLVIELVEPDLFAETPVDDLEKAAREIASFALYLYEQPEDFDWVEIELTNDFDPEISTSFHFLRLELMGEDEGG